MKKIIIIFIIIIVIIFFLRFLTPEDTWIKDKTGNWVKHGNPKSPKPTTAIPTRPPLVNKKGLLGFCGISSYGKCNSDSDCRLAGCNSEICQSKNEEAIMSACVILDCHKKPKEVTCGCKENQCQWQKK